MKMTQEWIEQFNRKCADFIGFIFEEDNLIYSFNKKELFEFLDRSAYAIHDLKFHSDWNWIMEVVDKITMYYKDKEIPKIHLLHQPIFTPKEAVIQAIDQFLDWYNKQKEL